MSGKSITVRWAEAKNGVISELSRLRDINKDTNVCIKSECGQSCEEITINIGSFDVIFEPGNNIWGNQLNNVSLRYYFPNNEAVKKENRPCTRFESFNNHWHCTLKQCEDILKELKQIKDTDIRLMKEATLAQ